MSTTETMPNTEVPTPAPTPYPFGLFSVAPAAPSGDDRWTSGIWWQTAACNGVGITYGPCTVDEPVPELDPTVTCGIGTAPAFTVYSYSDQSIGGGTEAEKFGRARDLLLAGEQFAVEQALWAMLLEATAAPDGTAGNVAEAIARAEQIMPTRYGGTPTLHMSRYAATLASDSNALRVDGAKLRTFLGAQAVAGGGYGDLAETPADLSVIATGAVVIMRGEVQDLGMHYDRSINNVSAISYRTYSVGWDCTAIRIAL